MNKHSTAAIDTPEPKVAALKKFRACLWALWLQFEGLVCGVHRSAAWALLAAFVMLGSVMIFLQPPFQAPDEVQHWRTAAARFDRWAGTGAGCTATTELPKLLKSEELAFRYNQKSLVGLFAALPDVFEACERGVAEIDYGNLLTYLPVQLARVVARGEESSAHRAVEVYFLSKFIALLIFSLAIFRGLLLSRGAAEWKRLGLLFLLASFCSPIALQQILSVSSDFMALLACVSIFQMCMFRAELKSIDWVLFVLAGVVASLTKPTMMPLIGLPAALWFFCDLGFARRTGYPDRASGKGFTGAFVHHTRNLFTARDWLVLLVASMGIMIVGSYSAVSLVATNPGDPRASQANSVGQIAYIQSHPLEAVAAITRSSQVKKLEKGHFYSLLGWLDTPVTPRVRSYHMRIQNFALTTEALAAVVQLLSLGLHLWRRKARMGCCQDHIHGGLALGLCGLAIWSFCWLADFGNGLALYLNYTPVGADHVAGLQGRYYLPTHLLVTGLAFVTVAYLMTQMRDKGAQLQGHSEPMQQALGPVVLWVRSLILTATLGVLAYAVLKYATSLVQLLAARYW